MDEFGVLTERYGLKPQGKSAPMAASKGPTSASSGHTRNFGSNSGINSKSSSSYSSNPGWNSNSINRSFGNDNDTLFQSKPKDSGGFDSHDIFGDFQKSAKQSTNSTNKSSFDYDSIFSKSGNSNKNYSPMNGFIDDDIFASMPGFKVAENVDDDIFGSFGSSAKQNTAIDDLLSEYGAKSKSSNLNGSGDSRKNASDVDDLLPGFGGSSPPSNWAHKETSKSTFVSAEDPFVVLESTSTQAHKSSEQLTDPLEEFSKFGSPGHMKPGRSSNTSPPLRPPPRPAQVLKADKGKSSDVSSIDELEEFAMGRVQSNADGRSNFHHAWEERDRKNSKASKYKEAEDAAFKTQPNGVDDLDSFFNVSSRSSSVPRSRSTTLDPLFDASIFNKGEPKVTEVASFGASHGSKDFPTINVVDDLSSVFGAALFGDFEEVEEESEERRRARLERHQRTQNRVARAVADMNQRDLQTQREQEERCRIAETLDANIKRWAAGKESNMRALLSSLQNVLWPECGWEPVSLADLITSSSVKKVYRKATLYVHPDKVQQKGASLEQKYTAEKVFDILKEAWNKFSKEELS